MIVLVVVAIVVVVVVVTERYRRPPVVPPTVWLWLLAEVESHLDGTTTDPCDVVVGVCLHGPPPVRAAAEAVVRDHAGAPPAVLLGRLCDRLATPSGDRLCATAAAVSRRGADRASVLSDLRAGEATAVAARRGIRATLRLGSVGCWLLLSPLALVGAGVATGGSAWVLAVGAVAAWWLCRTWVRRATVDARVLTGTSVHALTAPPPVA